VGIRQTIDLVLGETSKRQLETDFRNAATRGATALSDEFKRKLADNRVNLAEGVINEREFKAANLRVADSLKATIIARMRELQDAGKSTGREYVQLGSLLERSSRMAAGQVNVLGAAWAKIKTAVTGVGAAVAAAFTVRALVDFARASVDTAVTVGRSWDSIANAVKTVGGDFVALRPQIEDTVERIAKSLAFDDEEIRDGLTRFIRATGSVETGLRGIEVAAKLARASGISVEQATNLLTRALETGNVRGLTPFVGNLKGTKDVLGDVDKALGDVASTVAPFQRGTLMLSEAWEDLQVAIGNALIAGAEGSSVFDLLTDAVKGLADWVTRNRDTIAAWAKFVINEFVIVGQGIYNTFKGIVDFFDPNSGFWRTIRIGFLQFGQVILGEILRLQAGMLSLSESLPGDPFANQIRSAMERTSGYIGALGTEIAKQSAGMKQNLGADDPNALKTTSLGGGLAHNVGAGTAVAGEKVKELSDATKKHMAEMSAAYNTAGDAFESGFTGNILAGKDRVLKAHKEWQDSQKLLTEDLQRAQESIQSAYIATGDSATTAGSLIEQATRDAIQAKQAEREATEASNAASQNYAEEYWKRDVPLFLQGQKATQDALHKTRDEGKDAADTVKVSWLDAMGALTNSLGSLADIAGTTFGGIVRGLGSVVGGITAAAQGIKAFTSVSIGGLTGMIQKVAALAGGFGGVVQAAIAVLPIVRDIGKAIGDFIGGIFGGSKDSGRNTTNEEWYAKAIRGDAAALASLFRMSGRSGKKGDGYGGLEGWATKSAQDNAWDLYGAAMVKLGRPDPRLNDPLRRTSTSGSGGGGGGSVGTGGDPRTGSGGGGFNTTVPRFQTGGVMPWTGLAHLEAGELVLTPKLSRDLAALLGTVPRNGVGVTTSSSMTDARSLNVVVNLHGVDDREIPYAVVRAVRESFGRDYQRQAALSGNTRIGG
jgi:hypothetical protein